MPLSLDLISWHDTGINVIIFYRALNHNNEHMGRRYIEVFESKYSEMEWVVTRMQGGQSDSEGVIRLRGLPYGAQKQDIAEFFAGMYLYTSIHYYFIHCNSRL